MVSKAQKLRARLRNTKAGWSDRQLFILLSGYGFVSRESTHTVYSHPDHPDLSLVVPRGNELKPIYPRLAEKLLDELSSKNEQGGDVG